MKALNKLIEYLVILETRLIRRQASKRAARVACQIVMKGCRV